ncbi:uncharacterized protein LOC122377592 [Amphibalanus amphitrite]|uniref:uncharacterized protein LOC122377592 n=1 Tax=Amphibalanus amphitrite TaxID=1232801 RepID=UPI001C92982A|nr:uncharacterized protein LOC122377592 [Amphibalanus amphitrite]
MERQLPAVKVWLTRDGARRDSRADDQLSHVSLDLADELWPPADAGRAPRPAAARRQSLVLLQRRRAAADRLEPAVHGPDRRRSSAASSVSAESAGGSRRSSAFSRRSSSLASECSWCERPPPAVDNRLSLPSAADRRPARAADGPRLSRSHELAALRRPSTLSRLSQTLSLSSQRGSIYFIKGALDETFPFPAPQRLTFTQRLAFPSLAGEMRHKRRDPFNETEAHMNLFAKMITVVILCLVFVLLIGVMYKFLR